MLYSQHTCQFCLVECMDFRIQETVDRLGESLGLENGNFDRVSILGGAGKTRADLIEALGNARKTFPDCQVQAYFIYLDGKWDEVG